jgi:hypothetical protein
MKSLFTTALACLLTLPGLAQKIIEKTLPYSPKQRVNLDFKFANSIKVQAWDKPEVYVKVSVTVNNGKLNDALLVDFASAPEEISVKADFDKQLARQGTREDCPDRNGNNTSNWNEGGDRYYLCYDIFYEVYLPRQADLRLETINGNVEIKELTGPVQAKSISGYVDVSWPRNTGAEVAMQTISGEVYSDLEIAFQNKRDNPSPVGYLLKGKIKEGGSRLQLESISGDVYLRAR